ncbi:carboxypeptidase-like regulatory domain-containing protein [Butyricimonas virosa]|uniref:carboxypeptidase-like regulatory domain-containing protein n=1 Tax=Butyricimonas virosa TaxID=544645 RepID=UPI0032C0E733
MSMLLKVICGTMFLLGMSWNIMAKGVIKGRVVDSQSKEVLVGATVNVEGTTVGCATDAEGYFELEVEESGTVILVFRSVGYSEVKKSVVVDDKKMDLGTVGMLPEYINLADVVVKGSLAVDRKTPVALSVVTAKEIEEKLSTQEFPEILKSLPSVYATKEGGGIWRRTD